MKRLRVISSLLVVALVFSFLNVGGAAAQEPLPQWYIIDPTPSSELDQCEEIGTWGTSREVPVYGVEVPVCTLNQDVNGGVLMLGPAGLDGAGHTITGAPYSDDFPLGLSWIDAAGIILWGDLWGFGALVDRVDIDLGGWSGSYAVGIEAVVQGTFVVNSIIRGAAVGIEGQSS